MEQVSEVFSKSLPKRARPGEGRIAQENRRIAEQHSILSRAFKLVRRSQEDRQLADTFLAAMGDLSKRTKTVIESAQQIIKDRS